MLDDVLLFGGGADATPAAAALSSVERQGRALNVTAAGHGDHHVLLDDQILDVDIGGLRHDLRAPLVAELFLHLLQFFDDDVLNELVGPQDLLQLLDQREDFLELGDDLLALESGEPLQAHVQNGLRLTLVESQDVRRFSLLSAGRERRADELLEAAARHRDFGHQPVLGLFRVLGSADDLDHLVDVGQSESQTTQQMGTLLRLFQVELRAPDDDGFAVIDEVAQQLRQRKDARLVLDDREQDDAEGGLHRRQGVELVEDDLSVLASAKLDHHANALAARFVSQIRDTVDLLFVDELGNPLDQLGLVDLVGDFGDDDGFPLAARRLLDDRTCTHLHATAARFVGVPNSVGAVNEARGGEVGAWKPLHQLAERGVGVSHQLDRRVDDLPEVVGRNVRRHSHGDAGRTIDEQVRELRREHRWLDQRAVVVGRPIDRFFLDVVAQKLFGQAREPDFRVAIGRRIVAVDRAKVS